MPRALLVAGEDAKAGDLLTAGEDGRLRVVRATALEYELHMGRQEPEAIPRATDLLPRIEEDTPLDAALLCTETEARRRAAYYQSQVAPATAQLHAFRKATTKATGRVRKALDIFAQTASCRALRSRIWAEAYLKAAELLEDEAEGVREP